MKNEWTVLGNYHAKSVIKVCIEQGIPVVIRHGCHYPAVVHADGRSTTDEPYVDVAIYGTTINGELSYDKIVITAVGEWVNGRRRMRRVISTSGKFCIGEAVKMAKEHFSIAAKMTNEINEHYENAGTIMAQVSHAPEKLSRTEYIMWCARVGAVPMTDAKIDTYGIRYGVFSFPEYGPEKVVEMALAARRLNAIELYVPKHEVMAEHAVDSGFYRPDASPTTHPCAECGSNSAMWIAGAGQALCTVHQDDY